MATDLTSWALPKLSNLLPLDEESLKQIIAYTDTLSKDAAADHLKNLLGDSPQALEFITSFNSRRKTPPSEASTPQSSVARDGPSEVPKPKPRRQGKKPLNRSFDTRRPDDYGNIQGAYRKPDEEDYMASKPKRQHQQPSATLSNTLSLQENPDARQLPTTGSGTSSRVGTPKPPPSAAGPLISDLPQKSSRTSSPAPSSSKQKTKISIAGGTPMHGRSEVINDLDFAIRELEIQTNPSLNSAQDIRKRRCDCMAQRHPLLKAAPNCLNCGKIICVKEGLGPCTFCEKPLLSNDEIQGMIRVLREERGKEKMEANNAAQKRADVTRSGPRPYANLSNPASSAPSSDSETEQRKKALQHRDKLLGYQAQNAQRTRIVDEAADYETPVSGQSMWASPVERALQLKRQQKVLREQQWSTRPEYEKRRMVVSVDLVGGKVVKRFADMERPESPESDSAPEPEMLPPSTEGGGTFSRNPLLGALIRPVVKTDTKGKGVAEERKPTWRRVQDDQTDNEQWILDGGTYGGRTEGRVLGAEEHPEGTQAT